MEKGSCIHIQCVLIARELLRAGEVQRMKVNVSLPGCDEQFRK